MHATIPDLWPATFGKFDQLTPVAILRQQGLILGKKTGNFVYGEVESRQHRPGAFEHTFVVTAPFLGYRQPVVIVMHKVNPYPVELCEPSQYGSSSLISNSKTANSADEFMSVLKSFLQSPDTVRLIQSLVAQCQDSDDAQAEIPY